MAGPELDAEGATEDGDMGFTLEIYREGDF